MSSLFINTAPNTSAVIYGRLGRFIVTVINAVSDWNDARVTRNALSKLSDRELDDIGLCRGDIDTVSTR